MLKAYSPSLPTTHRTGPSTHKAVLHNTYITMAKNNFVNNGIRIITQRQIRPTYLQNGKNSFAKKNCIRCTAVAVVDGIRADTQRKNRPTCLQNGQNNFARKNCVTDGIRGRTQRKNRSTYLQNRQNSFAKKNCATDTVIDGIRARAQRQNRPR